MDKRYQILFHLNNFIYNFRFKHGYFFLEYIIFHNRFMGGKQSKIENLKFNKEDWKSIESNSQYDVVQNKKGDQAQLYHLILNQTMNVDQQIDTHKYRAENSGYHVRVLGLQTVSQRSGLCGSHQTFNVLTQRIPLTLQQCRNLNFQEANVVLYNAIKGFKQLTNKFGFFEISPKQIGFTPDGQTRVWVNENYGSNTVNGSQNLKDLKTVINQKVVLHKIINLIQKKTEAGIFAQGYRNQIFMNETFDNCLSFLTYAKIVPIQALQNNVINFNNSYSYEPVKQQPTSSLYKNNTPVPQYQYNQSEPVYHSPRNTVGNTRISFNYVSPSV